MSPLRFAFSTLSLALLSCHAAQAQTIPDAGQALRQLQMVPQAPPTRQALDLTVPDQTPTPPPTTDATSLDVRRFQLSGNEAFSDAELLPLLAPYLGHTLGFAQLQDAAQRLSTWYQGHGYLLARAYLPAQEVEDGVVRIAILEGRYDRVQIRNSARIRDGVLSRALTRLSPGQAVKIQPLEDRLLALQELAGLSAAHGTLSPGQEVGTSTLQVETTPGPLLEGRTSVDNHGNRYTGQWRLGGSLDIDSPLRLGDRLSLQALATEENQHYYQANWQVPLGPALTQAGLGTSRMDYELARDFSDLDAHGTANVASVYLSQPLLRRRQAGLVLQLRYDRTRLEDRIDLFGERIDKRAHAWKVMLDGNLQDAFGGTSRFLLSASRGTLGIRGQAQQDYDAATARTQGAYTKVNASVLRLQRLSPRWSLYGNLSGQWSRGNLDSSEKMGLGGIYGVRAYPQGEASGDQGWLANLELRYDLTPHWQLSALVDHGRMRINKAPWDNSENHRALGAAGLGLNWKRGSWQANAVAAWRLDGEPPQSGPARSPQLWFVASRAF